MTNHWIALVILIPLAAGVLTTAVRPIALRRLIGLVSLASTLAAALALVAQLPAGPTPMVSVAGSWPAPFGIALVFDRLSGLLICVASVVGLAAFVHGMSMMPRRAERGWFHPLFHLLLLGVNFSFVTGDLFNLFVAFEIMLMASYALMCMGGDRAQLTQAYKYVVLNLVGSTVFVLAAGLIYGMLGTLNYADLARIAMEARATGEGLPAGVAPLAACLLFVFALKGAVFPLWFWLPDTYHHLPATVGAMFAALLSKVGVYAILRLFPMVFAAPGVDEVSFVGALLPIGAGLTMVVASLAALGAADVRRVVAMLLIAHVGYLLFGVSLMSADGHAGALHYMGQEMLVIAGLMLCVGVLIDRSGTADVREMGGLWREMPWLATVFFVLGMALAGIPPLAGFYGKALVLRAGVEAGAWWLVGATLVTAVLTLAAVLRVWCMVFWSPTRAPALLVRDGGEIGKFRPVGSAYLALWLLVGVSVAYGLAAEPMLTFARAATSELTEPRSYVDAVLSAGVEAELGEGDAPGSMASANVGAGVVVRVPAEGVR